MSQVAHTYDRRGGDGRDSSPSLVQRAITKNTCRLVPVLALASQRRASGAACGAYGRTFGQVLGNIGKRQQKAVRRDGRMMLFPQQKSGGQGRN